MKTALAIICSFLLAGVPLFAAQSPVSAACAKQVRACCQNGVTMPCCETKSSPDSQPAPTAPPPSGSQNTLSLLAPAVLIWTLPETPADSISSASSPSAMTAGAPLYTRNCALLL